MATSPSTRAPWQRGSVFKFFASLKLAVVLLVVLIVASIAGTIYESSFDARVARSYVYGAPWFNLWLVLLGANLAVSALSRWPWRQHHVAFLVTHLGIITLLSGALLGRVFGVEGTVTLFKGDPPTNRLLVDEHQLRVHDSDGVIKGYSAEFLHHPPSAARPRDLGMLNGGAHLSLVGYSPAVEAKLNPRPLSSGGVPAIHFAINTAMMGQRLESWLLAGDPQHGKFEMGLARIEFKRGAAPSAKPEQVSEPNSPARQAQASDPRKTARPAVAKIEESIFAFANGPEQQIGHVSKGGSTGARISLSKPAATDKGQVSITLDGRTQVVDVAANLNREVLLDGTNLSARIENYWPDFRMENGKPASISDQPNNPAIVLTIRGDGTPVSPTDAEHGSEQPDVRVGPPAAGTDSTEKNATGAAENHLTIFVADTGAISYELNSRKLGFSSGTLELNKPLMTGWADWQLVIDKLMPHAEQFMDFTPVESKTGDLPEALRVRMDQHGSGFEQWVPAGWQITFPASPRSVAVSYGWRAVALPIALELLDFEVARNEGTDTPAGFKSTLRVSTAEGESAVGQCFMNHPFSFPSAWWRTWTGLTFKISQASWNPENLGQSTVQILRDPGWSLKWVGSLLVVAGVFMMFYVKRFRRQSGEKTPRSREIRPSHQRPAEAITAHS